MRKLTILMLGINFILMVFSALLIITVFRGDTGTKAQLLGSILFFLISIGNFACINYFLNRDVDE